MTNFSPATHTAQEVANWFLAWNQARSDVYGYEASQITKVSLNFLLWSAQGHYLVEHGAPLFGNEVIAGSDYPIIVGIYEHLDGDEPLSIEIDFDFSDFTETETLFLQKLWNTYSTWSSNRVQTELKFSQDWKELVKETDREASIVSLQRIHAFFQ